MKKSYLGYIYIVPCLLLVGVFLFLPIVFNGVLSFTQMKGINFSKCVYIGLENYKTLYRDPVFRGALINMFKFLIATVSIQMFLGLVLTVLLQKKNVGHRFFELSYFIPVVLSTVIIAYNFLQIYEPLYGVLNRFLDFIGLSGLKHIWLGDIKTALYAVIVVNCYQWTGMSIIYYRAGLSNISKDIYEVARIDGANALQTFFKITLPLLKSTHLTLIILGTIGTLKMFDLVYIMTQGGPAGATEFPMTYLYKRFSLEGNVGVSSAVSIVIIILACLLSVIQMKSFSGNDNR